ncbi:MAG: carbon-nitrogen hydrolase family protein [Rhodospirillales bacterium]
MVQLIKVAAAHVAPVFLDARATARKACAIIEDAGKDGVDLLVFPESFLPGFPLWAAISAPILNHDFFTEFARQSVRVPGPEIMSICTAARDANVVVSIGISESAPQSVGCLWNSNLLIDADGSIINHHRKLVPTFFEKLVWANGDGCGLHVSDTAIGKIGALICGENTNPLARYSLMAQGEQIHISSYPPTWPTHEPSRNERYDLPSSIRIRAGAHSFEAKVFNVVAASRVDETTLDRLSDLGPERLRIITESPQGVSMIVGPNGLPIAETSANEDVILTEQINLAECIVPKQFHDVVGYYNRFDIFELTVNRRKMTAATFNDEGIDSRSLDFGELERMVGSTDT